MEKAQKIEGFFDVFHTFFKFSPILAQNTTEFIFLKVFCFIWHPSHLLNWLNSGDISIFKGFFHTFQLQHHLVVDFYKWKVSFKLSCIVFGIITYMQFPCILMVPSKKSLVALSRVRSLWKELTKVLSVCAFRLSLKQMIRALKSLLDPKAAFLRIDWGETCL